MCRGPCSPTEARASPALCVIPGLRQGPGRSPTAACSGLAHLLAQQTTCTRSPGPGSNSLHCWGRCLALGGLPGCWVPAAVKVGHGRDGPGTQEDSKCQPVSRWLAQGPTEPEGCQAQTQPGLLGAWPPLEASSWCSESNPCPLSKGCWDAGRHGSLDTFWWAAEQPGSCHIHWALMPCFRAAPAQDGPHQAQFSQLPAASDCQFCDSNGALPLKYQGICSYRCREGKCGGYGEMPGHSPHMKYLN